MKNHIMTYNQINDHDGLSFKEVGHLAELGLLDGDLLKIYNHVKNGSVGSLYISGCNLTKLPSWLTRISGSLVMHKSKIEELPDNLVITGMVGAAYSMLKTITRSHFYSSTNISYTNISKLPDNLQVDGLFLVCGLQFEEIPKNLKVKGVLYIRGSNLEQFSDKELYEMYEIKQYINRTT